MKNKSSRWSRLVVQIRTLPSRFFQFVSNNKLKFGSIVTSALIVILVGVTFYYYVTTSSATVLVKAEDFPPGFSRFTQKDLMDVVADRLERIVSTGQSAGNQPTTNEGFAPVRPAQQRIFRAVSDHPSPAFQFEWKGFSLSFCRRLGMSLRAKRVLSLRVNDASDKGWRLSAMMEDAPKYSAQRIAGAPPPGGLCAEFEVCAGDLAEQILGSVDRKTLLDFYISQNNNDRIVELFKTADPASLQASDLVMWGDAFFGRKEYDKALQKYEQALIKDGNSCAALAARGYFYNRTAKRKLDRLQNAERDLRTAIKCEPGNKFTLTSLCHTLTQEWKQQQDQPQLLEAARQNCQQALDIDHNFVIAATNIGYILYRQGKHAESLSFFNNFSQKHRQDSALFANYGFVLYLEYLESKDPNFLNQAIEQTYNSLNLDPANYAAANNLGFFNYEKQDYQEAVNYWNKAKSLEPKDADMIAGLALGSYKLGRKAEAIRLLRQAQKIDSNYGNPDKLTGDPHFWSSQMVLDLKNLNRRLSAKLR